MNKAGALTAQSVQQAGYFAANYIPIWRCGTEHSIAWTEVSRFDEGFRKPQRELSGELSISKPSVWRRVQKMQVQGKLKGQKQCYILSTQSQLTDNWNIREPYHFHRFSDLVWRWILLCDRKWRAKDLQRSQS